MRNSIFKSYTKKILKSEAFVSVIIVFVLALGIIGTSYALYMDIDEDTNYQLVEVGDLSIGFDNGEKTITLTNLLPQEDENAVTSSDNLFSFYIYNRGNYTVDYDIKLIADNGNTIDANYINYQICRDNSENCSSIKTLGTKNEDNTITINNPIVSDSLLAKKSTDASNPSAYYFLRIWINNTYKGETSGTIKYKVEVTATNASGNINSSNTLAGTILNNAKLAEEESSTDRTIYSPEPLTKPAEEVNGENERTLSQTQDDYGTSYYFRGNVDDNYVTFADMCWRIVRIAGDGSIKLILEDQDQPCSTSINGNWAIPTTTGGTTYIGNFGYTQHSSNTLTASDGTKNSSTKYLMDYLHGQTNSDESMATAFKNFQSTFTETELSKLKSGNWCLGDNTYDSSNNLLNSTQIMDNKIKGTSFNYNSYQRLGGNNGYQSTLKCNGTIMNDWDDDETNPTSMYVGAITADEVAYAGGKVGTGNQNYYLINEEFKKGSSGANKAYYFWSLSPFDFNGNDDLAFRVGSRGSLDDNYVDVDFAFRPSVSLKPGTLYKSGNGKQETPYEIKMSNTENKVDETTE